MSALFPFRALRPAPEAAPRVASVPYDVVTADEARALAGPNPVSFLHVTRSEIDLPPDVDPHDARVYAQAVKNFEDLKRAAPLVLEAQPALYFYRLRMGSHVQTGLAGCFSVDEYDRGLVKKHERTRKDKEDDRTRHIVELRAQTGVVFLTYRAVPAVDAAAARAAKNEPLFDFLAEDGVRHTIWRVSGAEAADLVTAFASVPALYIADGHHRAASASRARQMLNATGARSAEAERFVAVAFPDSAVQILPYHRVVTDLGGRGAEAFLAAVRERMGVADGRPDPAGPGEVSMYVGGRWYRLELPEAPPLASRADRLDVARLDHHLLQPVLGIDDVRTDRRIEFVGGARGIGELERLVDAGRDAVAFSMFPVTIDDLIAIADAGGIMPPKSTWFEPKLRDGLLTHLI